MRYYIKVALIERSEIKDKFSIGIHSGDEFKSTSMVLDVQNREELEKYAKIIESTASAVQRLVN